METGRQTDGPVGVFGKDATMIKGLLILGALLGGLGYTFIWIVKTATPNDRHEYEAYMRWKERKKND